MSLQHTLTAAAILLFCASAGAQPCLDNFVSDGNFLTGKSDKTSAVVAGTRLADAKRNGWGCSGAPECRIASI